MFLNKLMFASGFHKKLSFGKSSRITLPLRTDIIKFVVRAAPERITMSTFLILELWPAHFLSVFVTSLSPTLNFSFYSKTKMRHREEAMSWQWVPNRKWAHIPCSSMAWLCDRKWVCSMWVCREALNWRLKGFQ